jgi:hypothetical protein
MTSGWSHRATQRFTSASSNSSISSKWRLATPSLLNGHSLSEGCRAPVNARVGIPGVYLLAPSASSSLCASRLDRLRAGCVSSFPLVLPWRSSQVPRRTLPRSRWVGLTSGPLRCWDAGRRKKVGPLIALMDLHKRPLTDGTPHLADDRLEAQTVLVFAPQLYLRSVGGKPP